ncbi:hypothetical protein C0995_011222 [Termitomyces sp. Mi166|nr:hypothetical protein C0995_011222 [Termitomyces sp. Mi166\
MAIPAPPPQLAVVVVTTDPRTPEQYDGLIATQQKDVAASKGKGKVVPTLSNKSDYGESSSEHKWELEEGEADANQAAAFEYSSCQRAKMPASLVYKFALRSFLHTPYELEQLYKHYVNEHAPHHNQVVTYLLMNKLLLVAQKLNKSLLNRMMRALLYDPIYRDLQSSIWGKEDMDFVVPRHIPTCFMHVKEDGTTALHVMHALDPSQLFDLEQIAQYALIFGRPGLENTWQGIAFDFAYRMHW